ERGWRRGATRSSYRGRDQAGATDVILDIKRLLLSPGNTSILPENIVGQSLSVGFRPLPQTTPFRIIKRQFGFVKARYKGLLKNDNQLAMLFTLANLFRVDQMIRQWERSQ
ncbi:hypothetical protein ACMWOA_24130, partial [Escherichia coli]